MQRRDFLKLGAAVAASGTGLVKGAVEGSVPEMPPTVTDDGGYLIPPELAKEFEKIILNRKPIHGPTITIPRGGRSAANPTENKLP